MLKRSRLLYTLPMILWFIGCGVDKPKEVLLAESQLPKVIDFNFHIKPILSDRCFTCHGPDKQKQKANLRLDIADSAFAALKSGNGFAIKAGSLHKSEVYHRIVATNSEILMPPPESNLALSPLEIAYISRWIEQGGEYKPHWAFTKPVKKELPETAEDWSNNEIDQFITAKLNNYGIAPSRQSRKEVLIRRLYFDLIGLPPSIADIDRLMADERNDYYEKLVDSLLKLPAYGERMAAHWLDVARFADSEGYLDDFHHEFWPYRDWVIDAYNKNLPYDDFLLWQVGGDQIPGANAEQHLATAFNRLHKQNSEGGVIPEEFRVEYVADRTNTIGTAFLGLTIACARCHDHKYDPISQKDYFELFGFFNSTVERGDAIFAYNAIENGNDIPNELSMNAGPVMPIPSDESVAKIYEFLQGQVEQKSSKITEKVKTNESFAMNWLGSKPTANTLKKVIDEATMVALNFEQSANGISKDGAKGSKNASYYGHAFVPGIKGQALEYQEGQLIADGRRISFERMEPFTVSFWIKTPKKFDEARVFYNGNGRIQGYRGWEVVLDSSKLSFRMNHAYPYQSLNIRLKKELPLNEWHHYVWTYDGSSKATGMKIYENGKLVEVDIVRDHLYRSTKPYTDKRATVYMHYQGLILGASHYDQHFDGGFIDDFKVMNREAGSLVASYLFDEQQGLDLFKEAISNRLKAAKEFYVLHLDQDLKAERKQLQELQKRELQTIDTVQEIMVMADLDQERPTYILERGVYDAPGQRVSKDVPETILPWPEDLPRNRYGLGKWLIHEDHPLTARVGVNQLWYLMFGRGIVKTNGDFGNQGSLPSHPELLDWLAVDFIENGWDVKRLIRQMVTSATYKQSSAIREDLKDIDPDNILLARSPRYRRSAEMVRDNVLAASGLLNPVVGGKSVFPYQPEGLWRETISHPFFPEYEVDYENGLYRRSLYTFWKRNVPVPAMLVFDASSRGECQVQRQRSNTPLQAMVLLNSPEVIEACRVLSEKTWKETEFQLHLALDRIFMALIGRYPTEKERGILLRQYHEESDYFNKNPLEAKKFLAVGAKVQPNNQPMTSVAALARVANTILNSTEAYYKN